MSGCLRDYTLSFMNRNTLPRSGLLEQTSSPDASIAAPVSIVVRKVKGNNYGKT